MSDKLDAWRLEAAMSAAMQAIAGLPEDEQLRHDTIEGQSDAFEMMDLYAEAVMADEALAERARERAKRLEARADRKRAVIQGMLTALELRKAERALYTASLSQGQALTEVPTNEALPDAFVRHAPDKVLIAKTLRRGEAVPGFTLQDKTDLTLTLRTG